MNAIQKSKGKKMLKTPKNKSLAAMEYGENDLEGLGSKKRKHVEIEESFPPKKSKKKRNNVEKNITTSSDHNEIIPEESNTVVNKKVKRKSGTAMLNKKGSNVQVENEENNKQQLNAPNSVSNKTKKKKNKGNKNEVMLNINNPTEMNPEDSTKIKTEDSLEFNSSTYDDETNLKNEEFCMNIEPSKIQYNDYDSPKIELNGVFKLPETSEMAIDNSENALKANYLTNSHSFNISPQICDTDNDENEIFHAKSEAFSNVNNNEKESKREVNVIDIKSEGDNENSENVVTISIKDVDGANTNEEDELLKQLERKLKPKMPRENINWPKADLNELLTRMEKCIPLNDYKPFTKRLEEIEWDHIAFKEYSIEECRNMWFKLQKKIRKYRILHEVINDAKEWVDNSKEASIKKKGRPQKHPDMPRKPLTAYFIFYLEHRDAYLLEHPGLDAAEVSKALAQVFQTLSVEEKKKYELISLQKKEEYKKKLEEFYEAHPDIPKITKVSKLRIEKTVKPDTIMKEKTSVKSARVKNIKPSIDKMSNIPKEKPLPKPAKDKAEATTSKEKSLPKSPKEKSVSKSVKEQVSPKSIKDKAPVRPHPPFYYFCLSESEQENVEDKQKFREICKEKWKHLPERNKLVWIHYAEAELAKYEEEMEAYVKKYPDYVKNEFKLLSKQDLQIKDRAAGKPSRPPGSAYNLFARKLLQSDEIKSTPVRDRLIYVSNQWKICSEEEKKYFKDMYVELMTKYKEDYTKYLENLPESERMKELKKIAPKMIKAESNKNKLPKEVKKKKPTSKKVALKSMPEKSEKLKEPQQPPISPFKYFCSVYTGDQPAPQAWKTLTKEQRTKYEEELMQKKKEYIKDFEKFLKSLTEEELEAFSKSRKQAKEEKLLNEEEEEEESDSYDSDESSEEEEEPMDK